MKEKLCWLIFVIDKSGSMGVIRKDMIGGFNSFVKSQTDLNIGECKVFLYTFDTSYNIVIENQDLNHVPPLTNENYVPQGSTALYDSLGKTIVDIGHKLSNLTEEEKPEKVLFVTITDGENNSHLYQKDNGQEYTEYDSVKIKEMIDHQTQMYNWSFAYLGANQSSWAVGSEMGYSSGTTLDYSADPKGVSEAYYSLDNATRLYRKSCDNTTKFCFSTSPQDVDEQTKS